MQLLKVHGSQNQFFILYQTELTHPLNDDSLRKFTQKITNSKAGILGGADGVLVINNPTRTKALAQMRVINADGSEASMCGNGLRTVARYLSEKYDQDNFLVDTMNANLQVRRHRDLATNVKAFAVEISPVKFDKDALPFDDIGHERLINEYVPEFYPGLKFTSIAVPNPHLISFMGQEQIESDLLGNLGQFLNGKNPYFSDGVNVNFAQILDKNKLFVRTFERGVGFTNACGTGMSATSLAFCLIHPDQAKLDQPITIYNPGGMVKTIVHFEDHHYWIELIGNATFTHKIQIKEEDLHQCNFTDVKITATGERDDYLKFVQDIPTFNKLKVK